MNDKKLSRFQFHFLVVLEAFGMLKNEKNANLDFRDNPIYLISPKPKLGKHFLFF